MTISIRPHISGALLFFGIVAALVMVTGTAEAAPQRTVESTVFAPMYTGGTTIMMPQKGFRVGIAPNALSGDRKTKVTLRRKKKKYFTMDGERLRSRIFTYDLRTVGEDTAEGPFWLQVKVRGKKYKKQLVLKRYDAETATWNEIPSSLGKKKKAIRATVTDTSGTVAVFREIPEVVEEPERVVIEGGASWYRWHGSAMNAFPYGTEIVIEDVATGKRVESTVVSTGPFIPGRVIDIPADKFSELAPLSQGVMNVRVWEKE